MSFFRVLVVLVVLVKKNLGAFLNEPRKKNNKLKLKINYYEKQNVQISFM